ncbi:hypothetical protein ACN47E_006854 [Coniothyrium glycines]
MKVYATFAAAASLLATASAHGGVDTYTVGTTVYQGWSPYNSVSSQKSIQRQYSSYDPMLIKDLSSGNIRCNNAGALGTGVTGTVAAGQSIKAHWKQWTHRPAVFDVYMAKCPGSCDSFDGSGKVWFKVYAQGLVSGTQNAGIWAGDAITDTLEASFTVPKALAPGNYLIRHELIALHQANNPQFYPECAQFTVTGSGTASPSSSFLGSFPGIYTGSEPGIAFNIDSPAAMTATSYPIPGLPVWDGTGSASPADPTTAAAPGTTAVPTTLSTAVAPSSTPQKPACEVAKYGQCGGKTYSGCTVCAAGSTCNANGDYYSQCM